MASLFLRLAFVIIPTVKAVATVQLGNTTLIGSSTLLGLGEFFGGIPFAEPPIGPRRLQPPILKTRLNVTEFNATQYGPACFQPLPDNAITQFSEDCLTINVIRPANTPANSSLPVMAWIYGGGFAGGFSLIFPGDLLVAQSVLRGTPTVFVSFNYRLGPLGFPQGEEAQRHGALNLGLRDQIAALEWVQANIGAFGGDKTMVTVFGESAGAISIATHMLKPSFSNLARATVCVVPGCSDQSGTNNSFECLLSVPSENLLAGMRAFANATTGEQFPWIPTYDGINGVLPDHPSEIIRRGDFAKIPFITGANLDEGTGFTPKNVQSTDDIKSLLIANFTPSPSGADELSRVADRFLLAYPDDPSLGSPFNTGNETYGLSSQYKRAAALEGDIAFQAQRRFLQEHATAHNVSNYGYLFTDPALPAPIGSAPVDGVSHGAEVLYVFGFVAVKDLICFAFSDPAFSQICNDLVRQISQDSVALSQTMVDYWLSFVSSLDPNDGRGTARQHWAPYQAASRSILQLNGTNTTMIPDNYRQEQIALINNNTFALNR